MMRKLFVILEAEGTDLVTDLGDLIGDAVEETPGLSDVATSKGILEHSIFFFYR